MREERERGGGRRGGEGRGGEGREEKRREDKMNNLHDHEIDWYGNLAFA